MSEASANSSHGEIALHEWESARSRFESLTREYGSRSAQEEAQRLSIGVLSEQLGAVREALERGQPDALQSITPEALGWLTILSSLSDVEQLESLLETAGPATTDSSAMLSLWDKVKEHRGIIYEAAVRRADDLGASSRVGPTARPDVLGTALILTPTMVSLVEDSLSTKRGQLQAAREVALSNYQEPLSALQNSYLSGVDITENLMVLSRSQAFREILDALLSELDEIRDGGEEHIGSSTYQAALRYTPLVRLWRDLRLKLDGRINHWVVLRHNMFYDVNRGYPQLEVQLFSHSAKIFHTKDDVDDILHLAVTLTELCDDAISGLRGSGQSLSPDLVEILREHLGALDRRITHIRHVTNSTRKGGEGYGA